MVLMSSLQSVVHVASAPRDDSKVPYALFNICNNEPIELARFIKAIETACGREAEKIMLPMQPGDVERTYADTSRLEAAVGYKPQTQIEHGIQQFVDWYKEYRGIKAE